MMTKQYAEPSMEVVELLADDVVCASLPDTPSDPNVA